MSVVSSRAWGVFPSESSSVLKAATLRSGLFTPFPSSSSSNLVTRAFTSVSVLLSRPMDAQKKGVSLIAKTRVEKLWASLACLKAAVPSARFGFAPFTWYLAAVLIRSYKSLMLSPYYSLMFAHMIAACAAFTLPRNLPKSACFNPSST